MDEKIMVLHGFTSEEAVELMRVVKAGVPAAADAAFAMTTETNLRWKVGELVEHVAEEHRQFKALRAKQARKG